MFPFLSVYARRDTNIFHYFVQASKDGTGRITGMAIEIQGSLWIGLLPVRSTFYRKPNHESTIQRVEADIFEGNGNFQHRI